MKNRPKIAILTDFGCRDWYVASMKGRILGICPEATLVDISHDVEPGGIGQGGFILSKCWHDFPESTVFLAVVDPGVGSSRRAIAVRAAGRCFVAPDNGLLSFLLEKGEISQVHEIDPARLGLGAVSNTFHGRDIFAPAAAHLAAGTPLESLGPVLPCTAPLAKTIAAPEDPGPDAPAASAPKATGTVTLQARIVHVDHFGNLFTSIIKESVAARYFVDPGKQQTIQVSHGGAPKANHPEGMDAMPPVKIPFGLAFSDVPPGEPVIYWGSSNHLEIAINQGSAAEAYNLRPGAVICITI